jgi:RHS repeat-associated protein
VTVSPGGRRIDRVSDGLDRVVEVVEYDGTAGDCVAAGGLSGYRTRFKHDAIHGLVKASDSARVIDLSFDSLGRRTVVSDSMLGQWQYAYDARGLIASSASPDGAIGTFEYDAIGRVVKKTYVSGNKAAKVARMRYDGYREGIGKLTSIIDETGASTFMYDAVGKQVATLRTIGTETYVTHQNYDSDGNITQRIYSDGAALKFVNKNGFLTQVSDVAGAALIEFKEFDTLGRPLWMRYRNGVETRYTPAGSDPAWCKDPDLYMCGIDATTGATQVFKARRFLDTDRNAARLWDDMPGEVRLQYERSRLRTATIGTQNHAFAYDDRENIVPVGLPVSYQPNSQLLAAVHGNPVTHDAARRVQRIATSSSGSYRRFDYDSRGSLRRLAEANGTAVDLGFNELGNLVALDAAGAPIHLPDAGTACRDGRCQHTVFLAGAPALFMEGGGKSITYLHTDFHGSVRAITDEKGQLLARYAYDPYGGRRVISEAASWKNARPLLTRGYLGAIELPASGYLLLGQRTYDSRLGRFHQPDHLNPGIGLLRRSNPYAYSNNNPYTFADANGQFPVLAAVLIAGAVIGAVDAQRRDQNILEGALRGAFIAGVGYYVGLGASSLGKAWGINAYFSAAVGQGLYSGALATSQGGDFGTAFGRGAAMGLVSAGIGRGTMDVIPTPETESFAGAFARQVGRDAIRGAASSVVVGAIYRDDNLAESAMRGAMYSAGYNAAQNLALLYIAERVSDGPGRWMGHSFVFRTNVLPEHINAMQLGFATLMRGNIYDQLQGVMPMCVVGNPEVEKSWLLLDHEHSHVWQYNALGANFLPAYGVSAMFEGYGKSSFEQGGAEFGRPGAPGTHDIPD